MELPDFTLHTSFNELRRKMGADYVESAHDDSAWTRLCIQLESEGLDVNSNEVEVQSDFTLEYKGQKVAVYIRDQHATALEKGRDYKFHISQCETLDRMQRENRYSRYVVTNRRDGKFVVNIVRNNAIESTQERQMLVCKNCINTLQLGVKPSDFSIDYFFAKFSSRIKRVPRHTEKTAPLNVYASNWSEIASKLKQDLNSRCEECKLFVNQKEDLHVHHVDGDKSNNQRYNLRVLCLKCHSNQPGHAHMKPGKMRKSMHTSNSRVAEKSSPSYSGKPVNLEF